MSTTFTGNQATTTASSFTDLTTPVHLRPLQTTRPESDPHLPRGQLALMNSVYGWTDIPPERQGVDFGQTDYFKFINDSQCCLEEVYLCVRLDGLAAAGGGVNPRYPDDVLCQAIERITFYYEEELQVLEGDDIHFKDIMERDPRALGRESELRGLNLTDAERIKNAQTARWYILKIPFWWTESKDKAWHHYAFQRLTRIMIQWRPVASILQQDVVNLQPTALAAGTYILDHFLRFRVDALDPTVRSAYVKMIEDKGTTGHLTLIGQAERLTQQLNVGIATHVIQLNTFSHFDYNLRFILRPVLNLTPTFTNNRRFQLADITSVIVDIGGKRYIASTDKDWLKFGNSKLFRGPVGYPIYNIPLGTDHPQEHEKSMGGFDMSCASTPQMTLTTVALPAIYQIDFYCYGHNFIRQVIQGNATGAEVVQKM